MSDLVRRSSTPTPTPEELTNQKEEMDPVNYYKGYGKVNHLEEQSLHHKNLKKSLITGAISAILLLTLLVGAMIGALIHRSNTESSEIQSRSITSAESIRIVCNVTKYFDSCFSSISSINSCSRPDPELIFKLSLQVAINELAKLSSFPKSLISRSNEPRSASALQDCQILLDQSLSQLRRSVSSMEVRHGEKIMTESKVNDMKTWISAAMTDQVTCLDGLDEMQSAYKDEMKAAMEQSRELMSNSLAIIANMETILNKVGMRTP